MIPNHALAAMRPFQFQSDDRDRRLARLDESQKKTYLKDESEWLAMKAAERAFAFDRQATTFEFEEVKHAFKRLSPRAGEVVNSDGERLPRVTISAHLRPTKETLVTRAKKALKGAKPPKRTRGHAGNLGILTDEKTLRRRVEVRVERAARRLERNDSLARERFYATVKA